MRTTPGLTSVAPRQGTSTPVGLTSHRSVRRAVAQLPRGTDVICRTIAGERPQVVAAPTSQAGNGNGAPPSELASGPTVMVPEDFVLAPGEVSQVDSVGQDLPDDVFRCFGCTQPACQVGLSETRFMHIIIRTQLQHVWGAAVCR